MLPTGIVFPKATLDSPIKDVNWTWSSLEYPTVIGIFNRTFCLPVCISNTSGLLPGNLSTMSIIARKRLKSLLGSFDSIKDRVKNSDSLGIEGEVACAECPLFEKPLLSLVKSYSRAISQYIDIVSERTTTFPLICRILPSFHTSLVRFSASGQVITSMAVSYTHLRAHET